MAHEEAYEQHNTAWQYAYAQRGLLEIAEKAGVTGTNWHGKPGIVIPLYDEHGQRWALPDGRPAQRWKNLDSNGDPKTTWGYPDSPKGQAKPDGCDIYFPLPQAIRGLVQAASGVLYIACGEPDAWTLVAVGHTNVISFFGEANIPTDLAERLTVWGVSEVRYFPDRDKTGQQAANKLAQRLLDSGIAVRIYTLPAEQDGKPIKDINDLFCALGHDTARFIQLLNDLPESGVEMAGSEAEPFRPHMSQPGNQRELPQRFYEALKVALGVVAYQADGWSNPIRCPFADHEHDDRKPAAGWHEDKHILRCFKCGNTWLAKEVGDQLGIDWHDHIVSPAAVTTRRHAGGTGAVNGSPGRPYHLTDIGNAQRLTDQFGPDIRYLPERKQWLVWDGVRWQPDQRGQIVQKAKQVPLSIQAEAAQRVDPKDQSSLLRYALICEQDSRLQAMIRLAQSEPGIAVLLSELDTDSLLLGCANGVIDLQTGELLAGRREWLMTKYTPIEYVPQYLDKLRSHGLETVAPVFACFLADCTGNDLDYQRFLQQVVGYTLTGSTREQVFFLLLGEGANGKSVFVELVARLLGDYAVAAQYETFLRPSFDGPRSHSSDIARLAGARFVYASEGNAGGKWNLALIKSLTGGDRITASRKYEHEVEFTPQLTLWLVSNNKPVIDEQTAGVWRRLVVLPFGQTIPSERRDPHLLDKLGDELPAILAWAVQGCLDWRQTGKLIDSAPAVVQAAKEGLRRETDTFAEFIQTQCELGPTSEPTPAIKLWQAYGVYCEEQRLPLLIGRNTFYDRIGRLVGVTKTEVRKQCAFCGISLS